MTVRARWGMAAVVGVLMLVGGVIVGMVGVSESGTSCGSAFSPASFGYSLSALYVQQNCAADLAPLTGWAWTLIIAGIVVLLAGAAGALGFSYTRMFRKSDELVALENAGKPAPSGVEGAGD